VRLLLHWVLSALAVWIVAHVVPGISVSGPVAALIAAAAIGLINATIGLVLKIITFPLTLLTLGLFWFVINALMLELAAWLVTGFHCARFCGGFYWRRLAEHREFGAAMASDTEEERQVDVSLSLDGQSPVTTRTLRVVKELSAARRKLGAPAAPLRLAIRSCRSRIGGFDFSSSGICAATRRATSARAASSEIPTRRAKR